MVKRKVTCLKDNRKHAPNNPYSKPACLPTPPSLLWLGTMSHICFPSNVALSNPPLKLLKCAVLSPFTNHLLSHFYSESGLRLPFHFFLLRLPNCFTSWSVASTQLFYKLLNNDLNFLFLCLSTCESLKMFPVSDKTLAIFKI